MEALSVQHVTKRYTGHIALNDVTLSVPQKSIYGLLGPNGAGKTTLIRIINQIINADSGEIFLFNEKLEPRHVGKIGYLPEERGLYKKLKVGDQLVYFAQLKGLTRKQATDRLKVWFKKFEITEWWNKKVEDLSKGMAQKVQFISTVMHEPPLIILDEPFSGFDPINAQLITKEILELRDKGSTIIFSTHRMETVEELCDSVALINKSRKILEGSKKDIKNKFKANTFSVTHRGAITLPSDRFTITANLDADDGMKRTDIHLAESVRSNELLERLIQMTEVNSFSEMIPSINEIFISLVKETPHE